ncbi:guanine nucleotide exchange factor for Rab-3A-like isoform X1 [Rhynchophorus ferrugineus]|uniref:guanine nucleotide exchange factor for Rab-3A-like isoform X1 n=2 Tax=Rhynchophorus ferrugineus TaxID=354439 RepID=UPI003FCC8412
MSSSSKMGTKSKQHKRVGSTGTTGDESHSSDEEYYEEIEPDITIRDRTRKLFEDRKVTDKVRVFVAGDRNSSDSSLYSDLDLEKCDLEVISTIDLKDDSDSKSSFSGSDQVDWSGTVVPCKDPILIGLQVRNSAPSPTKPLKDKELDRFARMRLDSAVELDDITTGVFRERSESTSGSDQLIRLQDELRQANRLLKLRDEELARVNRIRLDVEAELEDLTASLFQEAHNMVREANEKQAAAEKALKENQMKVDVLTAEVTALKTLVLTSTPSSPNPHLHPQISKDEAGVAIFPKKHRRSPSHYNLKYGRESSPPDSPVKEPVVSVISGGELFGENREGLEVDPVIHKEFLAWRQNPVLDKNEPFIQRAYREDITTCLTFSNTELSTKVLAAVENGTVLIEAVGDKTRTIFPKTCALMQVPKLCYYRMNIGDPEDWFSISQICRNRIIAVCDFLNYLKYIQRGLVKSSVNDVYWEITRLRKNIALARLGLELST